MKDDGSDPAAAGSLEPVSREAYEIGPELARGGLGRILVARDKRLGRSVAVKELLGTGPSAEARFVREALITARLQHPAIVPVHEAGRWSDGRPFYAMKLVQGDSLANVVAVKKTLPERLALLPNLLTVCEAMAYAHAKKVIHRDLKPQNILIGEFGETVVIDWGLAKLVGRDEKPISRPGPTAPGRAATGPLPSSPSVPSNPFSSETVAGEVIGTPAYMPPEQARAQPVDERADVYSLGAVLYFVLAGAPPYSEEETQDTTDAQKHPLAGVLGGPPPALAARAQGAPPDLLAIIDKAMSRESSARYPSARELAEDLRRFQLGKLVSSKQYTPWEILVRFFARHRAATAATALALLAIAAVGTFAIVRVVRERDLAAAAEKTAVAERTAADDARAQAEARARELILVHAHAWLDRDPTASLAWLKVYPVGSETSAVRAIAVDAESRGVAHDVWRQHDALVWALAADRSGQRVASASADGTVRLWDLPTGSSVVLASGGGEVNTVAFAPDDRLLASGTDDGSVWLWDLAASPPRVLHRLEGHRRPVTSVVFAPDGKRLWAAGYDGTIRGWELPAATALPPLVVDEIALQVLAVSTDGESFALGTAEDGLRVIDARTGALRVALTGPKGGVFAAQFTPSGELAAAGRDGSVWRWPDLRAPGLLVGKHDQAVYGLAYTKDFAHLVTGSTDRTVRLWRLGAADLQVLRGHDEPVQAVVVTGDGTAVVSAGLDRSLRRWMLPERDALAWRVPEAPFGAMFAGEKGTAVLLHGGEGSLTSFDPASGRFTPLGRHGARASALAPSPRGWITGGADGRVQIAGGPSQGGWRPIDQLAWASGRVVVLADGRLSLWNPDDGKVVDLIVADGGESFALTSDGRELAWSQGSQVSRCTLPDCAARPVTAHKTWVKSLAFSPNGQLLASGSSDRDLHVQGPEGERLFPGANTMTTHLAFDRGGQILVSGGRDGGVRIWRLGDGTVSLLGSHSAGVSALAVSPDGRLVASGGTDRTVRIWDVVSGEGQVLRGHRGPVENVIWIEPRALISAEDEGTIRLWRADPTSGIPRDPHSLRAWLELATTARVVADSIASP